MGPARKPDGPNGSWPRGLDAAVALLLLVALAPVLGILALAVRGSTGGPVLYRETRLGAQGRPFSLPKFRSLRDAPGPHPRVVARDDPRLTPIGRALRRSHLDELPQLACVVAGWMRLVGPRPERPGVWSAVPAALRGRALGFPPGLISPAALRYHCEDDMLADRPDADRLYAGVLLPRKLRLDLAYLVRRTAIDDLRLLRRAFAHVVLGRRDPGCARRVGALLRHRAAGDGAATGETAVHGGA